MNTANWNCRELEDYIPSTVWYRELVNKKPVKTMHYKLSHEYENEICGLPQFSYSWSKDCCFCSQLSAPVEHTMQLWHDACKLWRFNQKNRKEYRKQARKVTGLVTLIDIELSFESKCKWTNTELLLCFFRFFCVSLFL